MSERHAAGQPGAANAPGPANPPTTDNKLAPLIAANAPTPTAGTPVPAPKDFYWGVSTAAYQVEGAHATDGKGPSIWDVFTQQPKKIRDQSNGDIACDFYHRYAKDLALMRSMNIPHFRFSLSWSRIFPLGKGHVRKEGVHFYHRVIDFCLELGIEPWITIYHWDLPWSLEQKGGWTNREILRWFEDYVAFCIKTFGDKVKHWMILNEPMVFTGAGYGLGIHAPGRKGLPSFLAAAHHAVLCQSMGIRVAKSIRGGLHVGTTFSCSAVHPSSSSPRDLQAAARMDALLNRLFVEPLVGSGYPIHDLPLLQQLGKYIRPGDEALMHTLPDFIGVQNYTREVVQYARFIPFLQASIVKAAARGVPYTEMNWEVYPQALSEMLLRFSRYGVPQLIVTENGAAFPDTLENGAINDQARTEYLRTHIDQLFEARRAGVPVDGYFAWSFTDNFEWAEGYRPRFGLVHVDYKTQKRTIKASGHWYSEMIHAFHAAPCE